MVRSEKFLTIIIIIFLFLNFLALNLSLAQETPPGLPKELGQEPSEIIEQYKNKTLTKWDYLGKEWKNMLLKNKYIGKANELFTKFSIVFKILFNMDYSLSITLLVIILLWIFFAFESGSIIQKAFGINNFLAFLIGAGISIILAQLNFLLLITKMTGWLVFAKKGWWWNVLMIGVIILIFVLLYYFGGTLAKLLEKRREEQKKKEGELTIGTIKAWWKGFKEGKKE